MLKVSIWELDLLCLSILIIFMFIFSTALKTNFSGIEIGWDVWSLAFHLRTLLVFYYSDKHSFVCRLFRTPSSCIPPTFWAVEGTPLTLPRPSLSLETQATAASVWAEPTATRAAWTQASELRLFLKEAVHTQTPGLSSCCFVCWSSLQGTTSETFASMTPTCWMTHSGPVESTRECSSFPLTW